jgi:hypothetical protein
MMTMGCRLWLALYVVNVSEVKKDLLFAEDLLAIAEG